MALLPQVPPLHQTTEMLLEGVLTGSVQLNGIADCDTAMLTYKFK